MASSFTRFLDHTQRRNTVCRTSLDEWSARRRDLYLTTHNTQHSQQTNIHAPGGIRTHNLCRRSATGTSTQTLGVLKQIKMLSQYKWQPYSLDICLIKELNKATYRRYCFDVWFGNAFNCVSWKRQYIGVLSRAGASRPLPLGCMLWLHSQTKRLLYTGMCVSQCSKRSVIKHDANNRNKFPRWFN